MTRIHHVGNSPKTACFIFKISLSCLKPRTPSPFELARDFPLTPLSMRSLGSHAVRNGRSAHAAPLLPPFRAARFPYAQPLFPPAPAAPAAAAARSVCTARLQPCAFSDPPCPVPPAPPSLRRHSAQSRHCLQRGRRRSLTAHAQHLPSLFPPPVSPWRACAPQRPLAARPAAPSRRAPRSPHKGRAGKWRRPRPRKTPPGKWSRPRPRPRHQRRLRQRPTEGPAPGGRPLRGNGGCERGRRCRWGRVRPPRAGPGLRAAGRTGPGEVVTGAGPLPGLCGRCSLRARFGILGGAVPEAPPGPQSSGPGTGGRGAPGSSPSPQKKLLLSFGGVWASLWGAGCASVGMLKFITFCCQ